VYPVEPTDSGCAGVYALEAGLCGIYYPSTLGVLRFLRGYRAVSFPNISPSLSVSHCCVYNKLLNLCVLPGAIKVIFFRPGQIY